MALIYAVEDDKNILEIEMFALKNSGYQVEGFECARDFYKKLEEKQPDLALLDIMLPDEDGLEIVAKLRRRPETKKLPIIMVTAKSTEIDKVKGLDVGADDYLTKPFAIEELLARMRVAFKHAHAGGAKKVILEVQGLEIDTDKRMVTVNGTVVDLTKKEYELLLYLVQNKNIVLSREQILNEVWGYSYIGETNVVDVYIRYLRSKIDEAFGIKYIHTIRGVGYYVKDE